MLMNGKKAFLISIDTEGDNQWKWTIGSKIETENAKFLSRFQLLCEDFGFKPTYLTNYEMANNSCFVDYFGKKQDDGLCEIGMHLHAWNNPPEYSLPIRTDRLPAPPYLIEYPSNIMEEKIGVMTNLLKSRFGISPVVHRAGRWAMNDTYFTLLTKYGYKVDCSVTPGKNWQNDCGQSPGSRGIDYTRSPIHPFYVKEGILEVPMTVRENHRLKANPGEGIRKWIRNHWHAFWGTGKIWLRPNGSNLQDMLWLIESIKNNTNDNYLMFMIHSSELMPGGKGNSTEDFIEKIYVDIKVIFKEIAISFKSMDFFTFEKNYKMQSTNKK